MIDTVVTARAVRRTEGTPCVTFEKTRGRMRIMGDEPRLIRAIENLIDNAVSFSPPTANVVVSTVRSGSDILVHVDDNGPGVPPARRETIFRRFHSERPEGDFARHSGLGLAIAKTIVEAMGGAIIVEDLPSGTGARFSVRLPIA